MGICDWNAGKSATGKSSNVASTVAMRPLTSASVQSASPAPATAMPALATETDISFELNGGSVPGLSGKKAAELAAPGGRAPLQRPYVKHYKTAEKPTEVRCVIRGYGFCISLPSIVSFHTFNAYKNISLISQKDSLPERMQRMQVSHASLKECTCSVPP